MVSNKKETRKPAASDWQNREIEDWNAHTFIAYMKTRHEELFKIPYVVNNYQREMSMIKQMYQKYGNTVVKRFIDRCMDSYVPNKRYPGINFGFMYGYLRERFLPNVLYEINHGIDEEKTKKAKQDVNVNYEEMADYL